MHCPRGQWCPGPRIMRAHPCPLCYPGPPWAIGLPRPTLSDTYRSQPRSQPVNRAPAPLQMGFEPTFPPTANDLHFVNLTNPLTHITLTLGSLVWESLLPPITHHTMHSTFTPYTQTRWPYSLIKYIFHSSTHIPSLITAILLTASPNYLVIP